MPATRRHPKQQNNPDRILSTIECFLDTHEDLEQATITFFTPTPSKTTSLRTQIVLINDQRYIITVSKVEGN
jgi:hypothetical protein